MTIGFKKRFFYLANDCSSRVKLPFFKKVLIATANRDWFKLNNLMLALRCLSKGIQPVFLKYEERHLEQNSAVALESENLRALRHRGINLYAVAVYQICVDLQVFINDLDFADFTHVRVIKKWYRRAATFIDLIWPYFQKTRYEKVIILQGHLYDSAIIRWLCIDRGVAVVAVENTFNKDRIIWDDISGLPVNKNLARNFYWRYRDLIDSDTAADYSTEFISNIKSKKQDEHRSPDKKLRLDGKHKSIFYIGQVFTDASTLFGIGNFQNPIAIIHYLVNYAVEQGCNLIIKLHPKEIAGIDICLRQYDSLTHRHVIAHPTLYKQIQQHENIYYDHQNTYDTYTLIQTSDICVTINSQAGLESLLFGKPVITCGNAFYNCLDSVWCALDQHHLGFLLSRALTDSRPSVDLDQVYKFFYIFCEKYCLPKNEQSFIGLLNQRMGSPGSAN